MGLKEADIQTGGKEKFAEVFEDPLAGKIGWDSIQKICRAKLVSHRICDKTSGPDRLVMVPTNIFKLFAVFLAVIPLFPYAILFSKSEIPSGVLVMLICAPFVSVFLAIIMKYCSLHRIWDHNVGLFWMGNGRIGPLEASKSIFYRKEPLLLEQIHALQFIQVSMQFYELNMVLNNGDRVNIIDHDNRKILHEDAVNIAKFLGVPVWDAVFSV